MKITHQQARAMGLDVPASPRKRAVGQRAKLPPSLRGVAFRKVKVVLPLPKSGNHHYTVAHGRKVMSRAGRAFQKEVAAACLEQGIGHVDGRLCVTVAVFPPDRQRRDLDNLLKGVLDSLRDAGVFADDSQIDRLIVMRRPPSAKPMLVVTIEGMGEDVTHG